MISMWIGALKWRFREWRFGWILRIKKVCRRPKYNKKKVSIINLS